MSPQFEAVKKEAMALSPNERELLAEQLMVSLTGISEEEIEKAWAKEIEQRLHLYEQGKIDTLEVHEIIKKLRSQL